MENSSKVISSVAGAIVLFYIISLIISSLMTKKKYVWPPWTTSCPDYWITSKDSNGQIICTKNPINKNGLDKRCSPLNENGSYLNDDTIRMTDIDNSQKCAWAKDCQVIWENIDNKC